MNRNMTHIILTDQCTAHCEICYLGCSPQNTCLMDEELLKSAIDQAGESRFAKYMNFTGGEPFLFYDILRKGTLYARERGFKISVDTNGFWGDLPKSEIRGKLAGLSLDKLNISTDSYHRKYIPENCIENIVNVAADMNLHVQMMIGEAASGPDAGLFFQNMKDYKYLCTIQIYPFVPKSPAEYPQEKDSCLAYGAGCGKPITEIAVKYDGTVYYASSGRVFNQYIGNITSERLEKIIERGAAWNLRR